MALTKIKGAGINISAAEKLYFDGGGTTYIQESADGVLDFYADNVKMLELLEGGTDYVWVPVDATKLAIGAGKDLNIYTSSDDAIIENITSDKDIIFKGNDGGSTITALTLDISAAGAATFNDKIIATELDISGNMDIDGTSNLDVVDIDGAVDMASTLTLAGNADFNGDLDVDGTTNLDAVDIDGAVDMASTLTGTTASFVSSSADDNFVITSTDADASDPAPDLVLYRNSSSPADGDDTGRIEFRSRNDNSQDFISVNFQTWSSDVTDGSEDGALGIYAIMNGTNRAIMYADSSATTFNHSNQDKDFIVETTGSAATFVVDAGNDRVGIGTASPAEILHLKDNSGSTAPAIEFSNSANSRGLEIRGTFSGVVHTFKTIGSSAGFNFGTDQSGGTTYMNITNAGETTIPLQPAFLVHPASSQDNFAADSSDVTVVWGTEIFDQGGDFASNTFTAPVTGKYQLNLLLQLRGIDVAANYYLITIKTSNRNIYGIYDPENGGTDINYNTYTMSVLADMDASDTVTVTINQNGGTQQVDIHTDSYFSGFLAC